METYCPVKTKSPVRIWSFNPYVSLAHRQSIRLKHEGGKFNSCKGHPLEGSTTAVRLPVKEHYLGSNPSFPAIRLIMVIGRTPNLPHGGSIPSRRAIAFSSNGRTTDFEPVNCGSIPRNAARKNSTSRRAAFCNLYSYNLSSRSYSGLFCKVYHNDLNCQLSIV